MSSQVSPGIIEHINATHVNWVSLQPGVANFDRDIITHMGVGFGITILKEDTCLATLSNFLCPESTVARFSWATFLRMLASTPTSRTTPNYVLSPGVNKYITCLPFSHSGLDDTIFCHLSVSLL